MKFLAIVSALCASAVVAHDTTHVTFLGAADGKFDMDVPFDSWTRVTDPLSITYIQVAPYPKARCTAYGVDGSRTYIASGRTVPVGPPQTQYGIQCIRSR